MPFFARPLVSKSARGLCRLWLRETMTASTIYRYLPHVAHVGVDSLLPPHVPNTQHLSFSSPDQLPPPCSKVLETAQATDERQRAAGPREHA